MHFQEDFILRLIDCPFEVMEAYYTKSNSLFIESAQGVFSFDEKGLLIEIPEEREDEVWEDMVHVDNFEELQHHFLEDDDSSRRLVGINLKAGSDKITSRQFEVPIEIPDCLGSKAIGEIAKVNVADNMDDFKADISSMPFVIVADRDLLLYPNNIHLKAILPGPGRVGVGSAIYAGNRVIAVFRV